MIGNLEAHETFYGDAPDRRYRQQRGDRGPVDGTGVVGDVRAGR